MNWVFYILICSAFIASAGQDLGLFCLTTVGPNSATVSSMQELGSAMTQAAQDAIRVCMGLAGSMAIFLGVTKVAEAGGLMKIITQCLRPVLSALFPRIPPDHPALGAIALNFSANMLGLGNAATPLGIRAMKALEQLNPNKGIASAEMLLFLAINTASLTLLPMTTITLRTAAHSADPAGILVTTWFASGCSTLTAIIAVKCLLGRSQKPPAELLKPVKASVQPHAGAMRLLWWIMLVVLAYCFIKNKSLSAWILPAFFLGMLSFGAARKILVYDHFIEGAKEGLDVALQLLPYVIAIFLAVGMFRASHALDFLSDLLEPILKPLGFPTVALPMALIRPFSGSAAKAYMMSVFQDPAFGPDSYAGYLVSTLMGCSETTFYVIAVYCGTVGIKKAHKAIIAGLMADVVGLIASMVSVHYYYPILNHS